MNTIERARGRWLEILPALGVSRQFLRNKHGPCPLCGGENRYRFDDKDGSGSYFCNQCRPGDGMTLIRKLNGWDFKTAADAVDEIIGTSAPIPPTQIFAAQQKSDFMVKLDRLKEVIAQAVEPQIVTTYLTGRGLHTIPAMLRGHPALPYRDDGKFHGRFPAMVVPILGADASLQSIHRTYIGDVPKRKKCMECVNTIKGAAIRLFEAPTDWPHELGVGTGIETSIAAYELFKVPVWALISDSLLQSFEPPSNIRRLIIFGDNDASFSGQTASFEMAKRLGPKLDHIDVRIPPDTGTDWLDVLIR